MLLECLLLAKVAAATGAAGAEGLWRVQFRLVSTPTERFPRQELERETANFVGGVTLVLFFEQKVLATYKWTYGRGFCVSCMLVNILWYVDINVPIKRNKYAIWQFIKI